MNKKPNKAENVLSDIEKYEDTWTPMQKDEPMMAVIDATALFTLSPAEKAIVTTYFNVTREKKVEKLKSELLGIKGFKGNYKTLYKLTKKGMFKHDTKEQEVLLTPNIVCPRQPTHRIAGDILKESSTNIHSYTGAITNGAYYIHYNVLDLMVECTVPQLKVLRHLLNIMDAKTNTATFHISRTAKELKVRVASVREMLSILSTDGNLIYISEDLVTTTRPSQTYTIMLNPERFIKSLPNYVAFRYGYSFFTKVIDSGYSVNFGVFKAYIDDSVTAVKAVKATFNRNNKIASTQRAKAFTAINEGKSLDIKFIETDFINIKEEYINENY